MNADNDSIINGNLAHSHVYTMNDRQLNSSKMTSKDLIETLHPYALERDEHEEENRSESINQERERGKGKEKEEAERGGEYGRKRTEEEREDIRAIKVSVSNDRSSQIISAPRLSTNLQSTQLLPLPTEISTQLSDLSTLNPTSLSTSASTTTVPSITTAIRRTNNNKDNLKNEPKKSSIVKFSASFKVTKDNKTLNGTTSDNDSDSNDDNNVESIDNLITDKSGGDLSIYHSTALISFEIFSFRSYYLLLLEFFDFLAHLFTLRIILDPTSRFKMVWDYIIIAMVLYNAFVIPYYIAFEPYIASTLLEADIITTCSMAIDIFVTFRTGFLDYSGNTCYDAKRIALRYWRRGVILDIIGTFPMDAFGALVTAGNGSERNRYINCLKVTGLLRLLRLMYNDRLAAFNTPTARIMKLIFAFFWMAHLFASIFFFTGAINTGRSWITVQGLENATPAEQYIASLYWALTTMVTVGYGDIVPTTVYEQAVVIPILLLSALIYATIFGNMAYAIETITSTIRRYQSKMDSVKEFIKVYELPVDLQKKLFDYTNAVWNQNKGFETNEMLAHLPTSVKAEVMSHINHSLITRVPLFKQCSDRFLEAIILRLTSQVCLAGDFIFKEGDKSREMYFVRTGSVAILMEDEGRGVEETINVIHSFSDCPFFGEISLLLGETRTASAKATSKCVLSALSQQDFFEVMSMFPDEENSLRETAAARLQADIDREQAKKKKKRSTIDRMASVRMLNRNLSTKNDNKKKTMNKNNKKSINKSTQIRKTNFDKESEDSNDDNGDNSDNHDDNDDDDDDDINDPSLIDDDDNSSTKLRVGSVRVNSLMKEEDSSKGISKHLNRLTALSNGNNDAQRFNHPVHHSTAGNIEKTQAKLHTNRNSFSSLSASNGILNKSSDSVSNARLQRLNGRMTHGKTLSEDEGESIKEVDHNPATITTFPQSLAHIHQQEAEIELMSSKKDQPIPQPFRSNEEFNSDLDVQPYSVENLKVSQKNIESNNLHKEKEEHLTSDSKLLINTQPQLNNTLHLHLKSSKSPSSSSSSSSFSSSSSSATSFRSLNPSSSPKHNKILSPSLKGPISNAIALLTSSNANILLQQQHINNNVNNNRTSIHPPLSQRAQTETKLSARNQSIETLINNSHNQTITPNGKSISNKENLLSFNNLIADNPKILLEEKILQLEKQINLLTGQVQQLIIFNNSYHQRHQHQPDELGIANKLIETINTPTLI